MCERRDTGAEVKAKRGADAAPGVPRVVYHPCLSNGLCLCATRRGECFLRVLSMTTKAFAAANGTRESVGTDSQ
jgi:hypothetical protein